MINEELLKNSQNDFIEYKNDLRQLILYTHKVGGLITLPSFKASIDVGYYINQVRHLIFQIKNVKKRFLDSPCAFVSIIFDFDENGMMYIIKTDNSINYNNIENFTNFMRELNDDLQVKTILKNEYNDTTKAFRELMEK